MKLFTETFGEPNTVLSDEIDFKWVLSAKPGLISVYRSKDGPFWEIIFECKAKEVPKELEQKASELKKLLMDGILKELNIIKITRSLLAQKKVGGIIHNFRIFSLRV